MKNRNKAREAALYNYLSGKTSWTRQVDIASVLPCYSYTGDFHNSTARRNMTDDIDRINRDMAYPRTIIHGQYGIKIATESEIGAKLQSMRAEAKKMLKKASTIQKKIERNGQATVDGTVISSF